MLCFIVTVCLIYIYYVYIICRVLGLVKKKLVSRPNFLKEDVLDAHVLWLIKRQAIVFLLQYGTCHRCI